MMVRFSPASEFQTVARVRNVSSSFQLATSPRFEGGKLAQAFFDVTTLPFLALFALLFVGVIGCAPYILVASAF